MTRLQALRDAYVVHMHAESQTEKTLLWPAVCWTLSWNDVGYMMGHSHAKEMRRDASKELDSSFKIRG